MAPYPAPTGQDDRIDSRTEAVLLHKDESSLQKSDVGVRMTSKPIKVGPNVPVVHTYRVFPGPKTPEALAGAEVISSLAVFNGPTTPEALAAYDATGLSAYRKSSIIPGASSVARYVITPTLGVDLQADRLGRPALRREGRELWHRHHPADAAREAGDVPAGPKAGPHGPAHPGASAVPQGDPGEVQGRDKEKQTRETLALYKKHGVNPVSGCIPALIQLPDLRRALAGAEHAASPCGRRRSSGSTTSPPPTCSSGFPFELPFLGHWFNLLPIVVVGLMLVQTKLFSPPATTPEAEMQQKTMKYMMIFMAVMFYKVPSGLGIYFITSSLWSIGERLLLPKVTHAARSDAARVRRAESIRRRDGVAQGSPGGQERPPAATAPRRQEAARAFGQFMEKILEEARKNPTYRKIVDERDDKDEKSNSDDRRDRDRGKPRRAAGKEISWVDPQLEAP